MNNDKLSSSDKKFLRGQAHALEPLVKIGKNGLIPSVIEELNNKLAEHGLLKIKISATKDVQESFLKEITEKANCELVGAVGSMAILFRVGVKPISAKHLK